MGDQPLPLGLLQTVRQAEVHLGLAAILRDAGYVENVVGECQVPIGGDAEIAHLDLVRPRILREEFLKSFRYALAPTYWRGGMQSKTKRLSSGT